ncbi:hypothetical protein UPYG_G00007460 [Umbra pygmaea]|uniref:Uncharacterized protein n=1 Tax=Umbra pygmaea TaxID=75934 RepID=A0ABD0XKJ3_UMBPY
MSEEMSCSRKSVEDPAPKKRFLSPDPHGESPRPNNKLAKVDEKVSSDLPSNSHGNKNGGDVNKVNIYGNDESGLDGKRIQGKEISAAVNVNNPATGAGESTPSSDAPVSSDANKVNTEQSAAGGDCRASTSLEESDSAAIAAAEALASLTRAAADDEAAQIPCSSKTIGHHERMGHKVKRGEREFSKERLKSDRSLHTQAAAADSSTSLRGVDREDVDDLPDGGEEDDSILGSSSTPSSSFPSDNNDDDNEDDGECAIVSVKMAPEIRQSVAHLAQVQMKLDILEKKGSRLHQKLELKMNRQRRPQLDQRSSITQNIPGFWVTALLNHPHLSAHIDETDEDALSYMTNLEIESIKNNKLGYRIGFHFRRNPYFQNNIIIKELHLGMGGSPVSFSNPILWHRGHNLVAHSEPRRSRRGGVYQTFFSWFSDHSSPGRDEIAQILKDDLFRNPLRYYLTPLWEPRENGSGPKPADNNTGDDCVVISDSDDDEEQAEPGPGVSREEDDDGEEEDDPGQDAESDEYPEEEDFEEELLDASDDSDQEAREDKDSSNGEKDEEVDEDVDVKEMDESAGARGQEHLEDIAVDQEEDKIFKVKRRLSQSL